MRRISTVFKIMAALLAAFLIISAPRTAMAETTSQSYSSGYSSDSDKSPTYSTGSSNNPDYVTTGYVQTGNSWFTPRCVHGETIILALPIVNMSPYNLKDLVVSPVISNKDSDWPFDITQSNYAISFPSLPGSNAAPDINDRTQTLYWTFKTRDDVLNGYYRLDFQILYTDEACYQGSNTISVYVDCVGKEGAASKNLDEQLADSTPRIIITGFETMPAEVMAGSDFDLIIHIRNTSGETAVNNVQIDLTATETGDDDKTTYATFLPTSGSNTVYFSSIPAGGTAEIKMTFNAKASLEQRPYVMNLSMVYENDKNNSFEGSGNISIPVKQEARFDISSIDVTPSAIDVGSQSNVMFNIYNTGKTTLYNVKASFEADSITPSEAFVGNLKSGATGSVDTMLAGMNPTMDDGLIKVNVIYEDESGNQYSKEFSTTLFVNAAMLDAANTYDLIELDEGTERSHPALLWIIIILIVLVLAGGIVLLIKLVKNKRSAKKRELELMDIDDDD